MQRASKALLTLTLFTVVALTGCFGGDDDGGTSPTTTQTGTTATGTSSAPTSSPTSTGTGTGTSDPDKEHELTFSSDTTSGDVPLNVTFTADLTATAGGSDADPDDFTWTLAFGDGSDGAQGDQGDFPLTEPHQYGTAGNYTAVLRATFDDGSSLSAEIQIQTELGDDPVEPPQTHFEFGPSAGCVWDGATIGGGPPTPCASQEAGPSAPAPVDGFWIPLDERYWGLDFTSTVDRGEGHGSDDGESWPALDTDCFFFADDTTTQTGDGNNGGGTCKGTVPEDSAWMFLTPYMLPSAGMNLDFEL